MGVVYATSDFERGHIPRDGDHLRAATAVLELVGALEETELTVVHGSVRDGRSTVRSDLDVLVTYQPDSPAKEPSLVRKINGILDEIGTDTHVKIEANLWPADESVAARRERMYDLLFSRHLAVNMQDPQWVIGTPDQGIVDIAAASHDASALRGVVLNYTTYKHSGFTKAPREYTETDRALAALQRALELPKSLDRKVSQLLGEEESFDGEALIGMGMKHHTMAALLMLRHMDGDYTGLLTMALREFGQGVPTEEMTQEHRAWLATYYPVAIDSGLVASSGFSRFVEQLDF